MYDLSRPPILHHEGSTHGTPTNQLMEGAVVLMRVLQPLKCLFRLVLVITVLLVEAMQVSAALSHSREEWDVNFIRVDNPFNSLPQNGKKK